MRPFFPCIELRRKLLYSITLGMPWYCFKASLAASAHSSARMKPFGAAHETAKHFAQRVRDAIRQSLSGPFTRSSERGGRFVCSWDELQWRTPEARMPV